MIKKIAWNVFKNTGDIDAYMVFKNVENFENNINGVQNSETNIDLTNNSKEVQYSKNNIKDIQDITNLGL